MELCGYGEGWTYKPLGGQNTEGSGSANKYSKKSSDDDKIEAFVGYHVRIWWNGPTQDGAVEGCQSLRGFGTGIS